MNSLIYKALNRAKRSIRLIEIQSGDTELVSCVFHVVDLSDCPAYIALSYAWGPPPSPVTILIDGQAIAIRENLYLALRSIRNQRYVKGAAEFNDCRFFWIDAICIDQENILERNHQVELMSTLYSQAHSVIAWLGPEADDSWMAMIYFQRIGRKTTGDILSILASSGLWQDTPRQLDKIYERLVLIPEVSVAISAVLERGYWKRLWIIQEIVLAPQVVFLCGNELCTFAALALFHWVVKSIHNKYIQDETGSSNWGVVTGWDKSWLYGVEKSLCADLLMTKESRSLFDKARTSDPLFQLEMLMRFSRHECQDPRDKVFGLISLMELRGPRPFVADYGKSVEQVYEDVVLWFRSQVLSSPDFDYLGRLQTLAILMGLKNLTALLECAGYYAKVFSPDYEGMEELNSLAFYKCVDLSRDPAKVALAMLHVTPRWKPVTDLL